MEYYPLPKVLRHPVPILTKNDILRLDKTAYVPLGRRFDGYDLMHEEYPEKTIFLSHSKINERLDDQTARIEYGGNRPEVAYLDFLLNGRKFDDFKESVKRIARLRVKLFEKYHEQYLRGVVVPRSSETFHLWIRQYWPEVRGKVRSDCAESIVEPSTATFNRLYKEWLKYDRNILAILPRYKGPGQKSHAIDPESLNLAVVEARSFMSRLKPTKTDVFNDYQAVVHKANEDHRAEGKLPFHQVGRTTFFEIIDSFPAFDVIVAREGMEAAAKHFAPNIRSHDECLPGQKTEIDELKADMMTICAMAGVLDAVPKEDRRYLKKMRLWIVAIIDVATRYPLAAKVAPTPTARATLEALRLVMTDKTHISDFVGSPVPWIGEIKPVSMYMDHGSAFLSDEAIDAFRALGIEPTRPPTGVAKGRPHIESLFHTIGPLFTRFFDGRTFRSIREKGDYDPKVHASLAASEFAEIINLGITSYYNVKSHGALGGRSPHNAMVDALEGYGWMRPPPQADLIRAFGKRDSARMTSYGIVKLGIPYNDEWLVEEHMVRGHKPFDIIHDSGHLNSILVQGADGGWVEVKNKIDLPENLTEVEWTEARKQELAQNRKESNENYLTIRDFILRNRQNGKAATLRAGLDPVVPSHAEVEKQRAKLFRDFVARPPSGTPLPADMPALPPPDPLRGGTVARPRSAELEPAPMPEPSTRTSNFGRSNWDDE